MVDKKAKISLARDERKADERSVWQRDAWHESYDGADFNGFTEAESVYVINQ